MQVGLFYGAIYKREQDGIVLIHLDKCKGTQQCVSSCPYAKPYFNPVSNKSNKCIGCFPRIEKGVATACVAQCVGRAMHVGFIDDVRGVSAPAKVAGTVLAGIVLVQFGVVPDKELTSLGVPDFKTQVPAADHPVGQAGCQMHDTHHWCLRRLPGAQEPGPHRSLPASGRRAGRLYLLGLSGRRLATE